jgi:enterobacterial common antigen flippase
MTSADSRTDGVVAALGAPAPVVSEVSQPRQHSYGQILKSSALIGGSSVINIGLGIVRTKAMAVLLGPAGFGLMGLYSSIADLAQNIAGMGISSSGVRQIAESVGSGEAERIAKTATVLNRISWLLGILGTVLLALLCRPVSKLTFGSEQQAAAVALLSLSVFFRLVSAGQGALIQGMRRISDLAKMGVLGSLYGTIISIPVVFFLREKGVVPSLVGVAVMSVLTSWWYSRKIQVQTPSLTIAEVCHETAGLLKLGFAFMASSFFTMGAAYAIRIIVLRKVGFDAAGLYQSAWAVGGLYVGLILQAMGADFFPRLAGVATDHPECNRLVNEQALISLLLAGPGVLVTLSFAPLVIALLYSTKFYAAAEILRWICLGMTLRVITWPMGFILVAKGEQTLFMLTDFAWTAVHIGLAWVCVNSFGLSGAGMAFFGSYVFHGFLVYPIVRRLSGFRWSAANRRTGLLLLPSVALVFVGFYVLPLWLATGFGTLVACLSLVYSTRTLLRLVPLDRIPGPIRRLLARLRLRV